MDSRPAMANNALVVIELVNALLENVEKLMPPRRSMAYVKQNVLASSFDTPLLDLRDQLVFASDHQSALP